LPGLSGLFSLFSLSGLSGLFGLSGLSGPGEIADNWASHGINLFGDIINLVCD